MSDVPLIDELSAAIPTEMIRYRDGELRRAKDQLACEEPLEIRVRGRALSVTMRTPGHDAELAAGFLLTESVVLCATDIQSIEPCDRDDAGSVINVTLAPEVAVDFARLTRHVFASSSCGVCGKATIESLRQNHRPIRSTLTTTAKLLLSLPSKMRAAQATFDQTGGLHAAALFDRAGNLIVLREDVGRHNAVDKIIGHQLLNNRLGDDSILLVSGRTSFEIIQKALAARIAIVASVSAPSSLAVELARANDLTLVGFLREERMNIYSGEQRIEGTT